MSLRIRIAVLAALCVTQLTAAGWSIAKYESTLRSGTLYRFRTVAVDPADAFRGRYVAVRPSITVPMPVPPATRSALERIQRGERGYVVLARDSEGFARAAQVLTEAPRSGDYLKASSVWQQWSRDTEPPNQTTVVGYNVGFPFDRYYMNEAAAPAAQEQYWKAVQRNTASRAWLTVRVKDGVGVVDGLFIDGTPIETIVAAPR